MISSKFLILPILLVLFTSSVVPYSYASVESEAQEDIMAGCRDGQDLVYRFAYKDYVCVDPSTADRWEKLGLAKLTTESSTSPEIEIPEVEIIETIEFPGAPPPAPKPTMVGSSDYSACRDGQISVYQFSYRDTICTSISTAHTWERLGLAEIIKDEKLMDEEIQTIEEIPIVDEIETTPVESQENNQTPLEDLDEIVEDNFEPSPNSLITLSNMTTSPQLHELGNDMWIAVGYDSTNVLFIEGDDGIIVFDTMTSYESAKKALDDFQIISDKPIKVIVYTQENPRLVTGAQAFLEAGDGSVEIITHVDQSDNFIVEDYLNAQSTLTYSSTFEINISDLNLTLIHADGLFSDQTYVINSDDDAMLIADDVSGIFPFVLDTGYIEDYFSDQSEELTDSD